MKFDTSESRYPEINELADLTRQVFQKIPEFDRKEIESVCDVVVFWDGGRQVAAFSAQDKDRHVRVSVYDLIRFSDSGRQGVLAHEFGHAFDYAESRELICDRNRGNLERRADDHARRWGFASEVGIRDREREALPTSVMGS